ncbi:hypothetical protein ACOME3_002570 [Neoechinorhynchus agilis]
MSKGSPLEVLLNLKHKLRLEKTTCAGDPCDERGLMSSLKCCCVSDPCRCPNDSSKRAVAVTNVIEATEHLISDEENKLEYKRKIEDYLDHLREQEENCSYEKAAEKLIGLISTSKMKREEAREIPRSEKIEDVHKRKRRNVPKNGRLNKQVLKPLPPTKENYVRPKTSKSPNAVQREQAQKSQLLDKNIEPPPVRMRERAALKRALRTSEQAVPTRREDKPSSSVRNVSEQQLPKELEKIKEQGKEGVLREESPEKANFVIQKEEITPESSAQSDKDPNLDEQPGLSSELVDCLKDRLGDKELEYVRECLEIVKGKFPSGQQLKNVEKMESEAANLLEQLLGCVTQFTGCIATALRKNLDSMPKNSAIMNALRELRKVIDQIPDID